jgi:chloride channel protein, CIC family
MSQNVCRNSDDEPHDRLADFSRDSRLWMLAAMAVVVGAISAPVAYALVWLINAITNLVFFGKLSAAAADPANHNLGPWIILVPALGGLVIGLLARYGSEKIRGHGIPEALEAILFGRSRMSAKVAVLKPLSSAISIGTGGPFGAEGPIIMTGGAFGSLFAQLFHLSAAERKILLVAGAAGGMSAIFSAPIAAVLLAVELLLFEWRPRSFIPVALSSIVAAALRVRLLGAGPIFPVAPHAALGGEGLAWVLVVGVVAGLASGLLTSLVYFFEDLFAKLPIHWMWWPAIGGLCVGVGGWLNPSALGVGYGVIGKLLNGQLVGAALVSLLTVKAVIWSLSLGSGTSGGVLAPLLMIGGAMGAIEAQWIPLGDRSLWAMISMAAVMGGVMRSPLTAMFFALELTHDLNVMPGLLLGTVVSYGITIFTLRRSILTEKVARRGYHLMREYWVDPFTMVRVAEVMAPPPPTIPSTMTIAELARRLARHDPELSRRHSLLILDENKTLAGIITRGDILRAIADVDTSQSVLRAGSKALVSIHPDELVCTALDKMLSNRIGRLPVICRDDPQKVVGYVGRAELLAARQGHYAAEQTRQHGWIGLARRMFRQRSRRPKQKVKS